MSVAVPERGAGGEVSSPSVASGAPLGDLDVPGCDFDAEDQTLGAEPPADEWLQRRLRSFGASEVAALMIATGRRNAADYPQWVQDLAKPIRVKGGKAPRLFARKALLSSQGKLSSVAAAGTRRERELYEAALRLIEAGTLPGGGGLLLPEGLRYVPDHVPREWLPKRDDVEDRLSATPDAYCLKDALGRQVAVELKCTAHAVLTVPPHYALQLQAQMACMGAESGVLVVGQQWAAGWQPDGPVCAWDVERDDAVITELREAAREGWAVVQQLVEGVSNG